MAILFLIYILICYKIDLPVYWYDWTIFAFLEIVAIAKMLFTDEVKESYEKGLREGMQGPPPESIFCELDDEDL